MKDRDRRGGRSRSREARRARWEGRREPPPPAEPAATATASSSAAAGRERRVERDDRDRRGGDRDRHHPPASTTTRDRDQDRDRDRRHGYSDRHDRRAHHDHHRHKDHRERERERDGDKRHRDHDRDRRHHHKKDGGHGHGGHHHHKDDGHKHAHPPARAPKASTGSTISSSHGGDATEERQRRERQKKTQYSGGKGDLLDDGRFKVIRKLGEGTFSKVMECHDSKHDRHVAVKIIRAEKRYMEGADEELEVLKFLAKGDSSNSKRILRILYTFMERKDGLPDRHTCIVVPLYGPSVFEVLDHNGNKGFTNSVVRSIMYQLVSCMEYVHSFGIVHTDIKPENVLFKSPKMMVMENDVLYPLSAEIVVIDFGSAYNPRSEDAYKRHTVGTRHYRAPEAVLHLDWGTPADVWAIGTMMVELSLGECMFQTHDSLEHLAMMEHVIGPFPPHMAARGREAAKAHDHAPYHRPDGAVDWPTRGIPDDDVQFVRALPNLRQQCAKMTDKTGSMNHFHDLIVQMLQYDPDKRVTCKEALRSYKFLGIEVPPFRKKGAQR